MHIYSSPRNMSVNFGSVSTKHEQHSLPNRLYPRQIWHCAHSFCFVSFYIYFFWSLNHPYLLCFWCIIWKNSTKISRHFSFFFYFSRSLCRRYFNPAPSSPPRAYTRSLHLLLFLLLVLLFWVTTFRCVMVLGHLFGPGGSVENTVWPTAGVHRRPPWVWLQAFLFLNVFFFICFFVCLGYVLCTRASGCATWIRKPK